MTPGKRKVTVKCLLLLGGCLDSLKFETFESDDRLIKT